MKSIMDGKAEAKEKKLLEGIKSNPGVFYKHLNRSRKAKTKIGPLLTGRKYDSDPKRMANILSE